MLWRTVKRILALLPSSSSRRLLASSSSGERRRSSILLHPYRFRSSSPLVICTGFHSQVQRDRASHGSGSFDEDDDEDDEEEGERSSSPVEREDIAEDVDAVISSLEGFDADGADARRRLELCGAAASPELVQEVLSRLRNHWSAAFTFFLWAGNQNGYAHSIREYHSMIGILGKMRRFDTAWSLIEQMKRASILSPKTLIILIRRYAAARDVAKSISTFYAMRRFGFSAGMEEFHGLLSALCRYNNVADAEHLLSCNEAVFPLEIKSFNIVLNGWCNAVVSLREARRFWGEMTRREMQPDAISYGSMISCCSKAGKLNDALKLFDRMRNLGIDPDRKVYNSLIYALAMAGCFEKAKSLMKTMEEKGFSSNAVTFNSLIRALCKARRPEDAREMLDEMRRRGLAPTVRTFHAIFRTIRSSEELFEMLELMKKTGCPPASETYVMLIRKLCRWRHLDGVSKLWEEMSANGGGPDRSAYVVLIHGLFLAGRLVEASKYYEEMQARGFPPEPRTDEMMQAWLSGRYSLDQPAGGGAAPLEPSQPAEDSSRRRRRRRGMSSTPRPEERSVTRERGFSLLN